MELIEYGELTERRRSELEGDEADPFDLGERTLQFRPKQRHVGLRDADGTLVASAGWVIAEVQIGEPRFTVVGLGGVIVRAAFRGRGLAREVVEAAIATARAPATPYALLFCRPDRSGLYERLGFAHVEGEVLVEQPGGRIVVPFETMWRGLRQGADWPAGPLTLHGLPF